MSPRIANELSPDVGYASLWDPWMGGQIRVSTHSADFTCTTAQFRDRAHGVARRRGLRTITRACGNAGCIHATVAADSGLTAVASTPSPSSTPR